MSFLKHSQDWPGHVHAMDDTRGYRRIRDSRQWKRYRRRENKLARLFITNPVSTADSAEPATTMSMFLFSSFCLSSSPRSRTVRALNRPITWLADVVRAIGEPVPSESRIWAPFCCNAGSLNNAGVHPRRDLPQLISVIC